jgi:NitT/TauT family transport system ATP-binding protein
MNHPVEVQSLSVSYGPLPVLTNLSVTVRAREFVAIVGGSGSGKTTFLNALAGFIAHTGQIRMPHRLGVVFQDHSVFPWMTVEQNIAFGLNNLGEPERRAVVERHLRLIQMEEKRRCYPAELSGGQVQRVGIARALAPKPELVLMDEPYASLDRPTRDKMQSWLLNIWEQEQITILFVTHDLEEALYLSDRILILRNGHMQDDVPVPFGRPRSEDIKFSTEFIRLKRELYEAINDDSASADTGRSRLNG